MRQNHQKEILKQAPYQDNPSKDDVKVQPELAVLTPRGSADKQPSSPGLPGPKMELPNSRGLQRMGSKVPSAAEGDVDVMEIRRVATPVHPSSDEFIRKSDSLRAYNTGNPEKRYVHKPMIKLQETDGLFLMESMGKPEGSQRDLSFKKKSSFLSNAASIERGGLGPSTSQQLTPFGSANLKVENSPAHMGKRRSITPYQNEMFLGSKTEDVGTFGMSLKAPGALEQGGKKRTTSSRSISKKGVPNNAINITQH